MRIRLSTTKAGVGVARPHEWLPRGRSSYVDAAPGFASCKLRGGNGVKGAREQCDDGVDNGVYGTCKSDCRLAPYCGDGIKNGNDTCDEGAKNVALASA